MKAQSLPSVVISQVTGFLELLENLGGKTSTSELLFEHKLSMDQVIPPIVASEQFGFIKCENDDLFLTELGLTFVKSGARERRRLLAQKLPLFEPFATIIQTLHQQKELTKEEVLEIAASKIEVTESEEQLFRHILSWGCYANLFRYDGDEEKLLLPRHIK